MGNLGPDHVVEDSRGIPEVPKGVKIQEKIDRLFLWI
jgi:hypothetical protein